jgi:predicted RNase H-like HicB family nuclease
MLQYPVRFTAGDENRIVAFLPDWPELSVTADSEEEALGRLQAMLEQMVKARVVGGMELPPASDICGAPQIEVAGFELK